MKKYAILTSVLALAACGGGSGGGAGTTMSVTKPVVPGDTTVHYVDSDSGLAMLDINKTRNARYEQAVTTVASIETEYENSGTEPQMARIATRNATKMQSKSANNTADIDAAYQTMYDILVRSDTTGKTNRDILLALALSGMDKDKILNLLGHADISLSEKLQNFLKILQGTDKPDDIKKIISDADYAYKDFGREFTLNLDKAQFSSTSDNGYFTFVFQDGKVVGLKEIEEGNIDTAGPQYDVVKGGEFKIENKGIEYSFENIIVGNNGNSADADVLYPDGTHPTDAQIRADLLAAAKRNFAENSSELDDLTKWIQDADIIQHGEKCNNPMGCIEYAHADYTDTITISSKGKELGLKYSDFGLKLDKTIFHEGEYKGLTYREHTVFAGGYKEKEANKPTSDMTFSGLAYAGVTRKNNSWTDASEYQEPEINFYNGSANLTVSTGGQLNQKLVADFTGDGWYKVTVDNFGNMDKNNIRFDGSVTDNKFAVNPGMGELENADIKYYGPDKNTPTEATGYVQYVERAPDVTDDTDWDFKADIAFGVKRN